MDKYQELKHQAMSELNLETAKAVLALLNKNASSDRLREHRLSLEKNIEATNRIYEHKALLKDADNNRQGGDVYIELVAQNANQEEDKLPEDEKPSECLLS